MARIESNDYNTDKREAEFWSLPEFAPDIACIKIKEFENQSTLTTSEIHLNLKLNSRNTLLLLHQLRVAVDEAMKWAIDSLDSKKEEKEDEI